MAVVPLILSLLLSPPPTVTPVAVVASLERLARQPLWPGFDPAKAPVAIWDGRWTWLFRHPSPPAGFVAKENGFVHEGRLPEVMSNSSAEIGGVLSATLLLTGKETSADEAAATAIHELFHVFERERHADWAANEVALLHTPFEDAELLALRRLEHAALRRALAAPGGRAEAAAALALRKERFAKLPEESAAYERATELNEGLAQYVEDLALGRRAGRLGAGEFPPEAIRQRGYATGQAFALLLDRSDPAWKEKLAPGTTLDGLLATALADAAPAAVPPAEREAALRRARADVEGLAKERARLLRDLLARPGFSLVVVAKEGSPLFPQRFDPWNLRLLAASQVLHARALTAGNGAGALEVFGREALSEAAGPDPLFTGMRRVLVTGLPSAPRVTTGAQGGVVVEGEGVTARFADARVRRDGKVVEIRLE